MDILKRVLTVMVVILILVAGAGLYYSTRHTDHSVLPGNQQPNAQVPNNTAAPKQKVNVILEPDLVNYIDEINKGISLINEANGLITADPFFADPPKVPAGKLETTPLDKQLPEKRDSPMLLLPDGTYQIIAGSGSDMRDIHRGIYKLGQGMTVLNSVLDRMNQDIKNNNFPIRTSWINPAAANMQNIPGVNNTTGTDTMTNMAHSTTAAAGSLLDWGSATNFLYLILIAFLLLGIFSIIGFVLSLFRSKNERVE